jgi:hypothetical protein
MGTVLMGNNYINQKEIGELFILFIFKSPLLHQYLLLSPFNHCVKNLICVTNEEVFLSRVFT